MLNLPGLCRIACFSGQSREVTLSSDFVGQSVQCAARTYPSEAFVYSLPVQFQKYGKLGIDDSLTL